LLYRSDLFTDPEIDPEKDVSRMTRKAGYGSGKRYVGFTTMKNNAKLLSFISPVITKMRQ